MKMNSVKKMFTVMIILALLEGLSLDAHAEENDAALAISNEIQYNGEIPEARREKLQDAVSALPSGIAGKFSEAGWHIELTTDDLATRFYPGRFPVGGVLASTSFKFKTIYFGNTDKAVTPKAVYHEMGHVIDNLSGRPYLTKKWRSLYESEKDKFTGTDDADGYSKTNAQEYFASCFAEYFINNAQFKESAPESYAYMENFIENL